MNFKKYQSVKRPQKLLYKDYESRLKGQLFAFPKLDGANASVWLNEDGSLGSGSRNQNLTGDGGLQGFREWCLGHEEALKQMIKHLEDLTDKGVEVTVYGEWLVPHCLKDYVESAWRDFHIFDVMYIDPLEREAYIPYNSYEGIVKRYGFTVIEPLKEFPEGATEEQLLEVMDSNRYLLTEDGEIGEGIVVKDYDLAGRSWIKYVHPSFSGQKAVKTRKVWNGESIEEKVAREFLTVGFVNKEYNKIIETDPEIKKGKMIPQLLGRVFHSFIEDFTFDILRKHKNATIDFGALRKVINMTVKDLKPELF